MEQTAHAPSSAPLAPKPIPTPPDFPVQWAHPDQARAFWTREVMHFPEQLLPFNSALAARMISHGFAVASETYGLPVKIVYHPFNTYMYSAVIPAVPVEQMEEQGKRAEATIGEAMGQLRARWDTGYFPEIQRHLARCEQFDLQGASNAELLAHYERAFAGTERLWDIHFLIAVLMLITPSIFQDLCADLFPGEDNFAAFRFLQGLSNKTVEGNAALWKLSRGAIASPEVRAVFETRGASEVMGALEQSEAGRAFLTRLHAYLDEYGQRGSSFFDFDQPTWIEDPTPVLRTIADYMGQPDRDPDAEQATLAAERERVIAEARDRLSGYPQAVREQFAFLLKAAQDATVLSEDHNFWIDCRGMYQFRRIVLEFGRRLAAAGAIVARDDVFYLTPDEMRESLAARPAIDRTALVRERKAEKERWSAVRWPPVLGTEPPGPPPDNPLFRAVGRFFGGPPQPTSELGVLKGNAGSKGIVRGTARVVRSLADAGKLQQGDILVAETTSPPWTPLFARAAAVVTDTGGILSHCAVVAREYMIPAVVGIGMATHAIQDGQTIEVDGTAGIVRIISA
jgi:phosphohistidine swiveling domain-containing protein